MDNDTNETAPAAETAETPVARKPRGGRPAIERDSTVWVEPGRESQLREGRVVSNKMQKTVVIAVDRLVRHRLYKKIMRRTSKFMAHDELKCNIGDVVRIVETRPISKQKRWRVVEIVERAPQVTLVRGDIAR